MQRFIVGVDGSPASRDALRWAAAVARRADIELTAVRACALTQAAGVAVRSGIGGPLLERPSTRR